MTPIDAAEGRPDARSTDPACAGSEAGAAMMMTLMFIFFVGGLLIVLLAALLGQLAPQQFVQSSTRSVYAAQAGLQSGLSILRSNTRTVGTGPSAVTYGDVTKLPKTPVTGTVDGVSGSALAYTVTFTYFTANPSGRSDSWLAANAMPVSSLSITNQPVYARIVATGTDSATGTPRSRTVAAVYAFNTTNVNIPGGLILNADGTKCLKASSSAAGSTMTMVALSSCTDDTKNLWVYDTDYKLKLASTIATPSVMCITGRVWTSSSASPNATLAPCAASNAAAPGNQLWSWDSPDSWVGQNQDTVSGRSSRWLALSSDVLVDSGSAARTFTPQPAVGAGGASYAMHQIVNYREFGRCMDVTDVQIDKTFMIVYPCKQDPTGTGNAILWNHKWYYAEPTAPSTTTAWQNVKVYINNNTSTANTRCLTVASSYASATPTTDVTFKNCDPGNTLQRFVRNNETGNTISSWTFQLDQDRTKCLAAVPESGYAWSHIRIMTCDGSTAQKWNAPAVTTGSKLGDYQELG